MAGYYDNDVNCAVYRSSDPIANFKIRVKLERLTSNALLPSLQRLKIQEDLSRLLDIDDKKTAEKKKASKTDIAQVSDESKQSDYEEVVIGWQQKIFNRLEFDQYGKIIGTESTALDRKYYEDIQKMKAIGKQPKRVFTYVEGDPNCFAKNLEYFMTDSPNEEPSELALGINNIRKRRGVQSRLKTNNDDHLPKTNLINHKLTLDDIRTNHLAALPHQTMYIMADLSQKSEHTVPQLALVPQPMQENILCTIRIYSNGTIVMEPDFNTGKMAYIVETGGINNEVFHYYLEHHSIKMNKDDYLKEKKLLNEIHLRKQAHLAQLVGNDFEKPLPAMMRMNIYGEIVSGKNFDYNDLYVYYCLDLPELWRAETSMIFSGYTHTASTTESSKNDDIVYYGHPFEFEFWYKPPSIVDDDDKLPPMPKIYFQVASQDAWGRHRTEGYTYMDIPSFPGFYDEELSCWRPRGDSIFNELRRFFIGGSNELDDISYTAIPKQFLNDKIKNPLSRFGFRTISTGTLNVRLNVVLQSQEIALEYNKGRHGRGKSRFGFDAFMSNFNTTLDAYERAKRHAAEVRESTLKMITPKEPYYE